jgi:hypothetical protein
MILLLKMLLAHFAGDFLLQPDRWVRDRSIKKLRSPGLYWHMGVHALLLAILLEFDTRYWIGYLVIIITHFLTDITKTLKFNTTFRSEASFVLDQAIHVIIIIMVVWMYHPFEIAFHSLFTYFNLLLATSIIMVTFVSAIAIKIFISKWNPEGIENKQGSLAKAGRFIGILERLFVFIFVVIGRWEAVGFLLAAKSVFRFGDLKESKDRKLTEYILIGTLLSFGIAILIGLLFLNLQQYQ